MQIGDKIYIRTKYYVIPEPCDYNISEIKKITDSLIYLDPIIGDTVLLSSPPINFKGILNNINNQWLYISGAICTTNEQLFVDWLKKVNNEDR
jgi:hypothetical protein